MFAAMGAVMLAVASGAWAEDKAGAEAKKSVTQLQEEFRKLKVGMFIHYNMATYKGVQWVEGYPSPADFNPGVDTIDTHAWADAAVSAGMTYGVLTVKHVGGFCLWDSKYTTYDVMHPDCPYKKDLVAQFIKSFKSRGLKVGLYYCWRHARGSQMKTQYIGRARDVQIDDGRRGCCAVLACRRWLHGPLKAGGRCRSAARIRCDGFGHGPS
ncbi:MAG: alpha-L-fucosidase [Planctomycetota bacterium]|jgi:alpha-L-fucosidase